MLIPVSNSVAPTGSKRVTLLNELNPSIVIFSKPPLKTIVLFCFFVLGLFFVILRPIKGTIGEEGEERREKGTFSPEGKVMGKLKEKSKRFPKKKERIVKKRKIDAYLG